MANLRGARNARLACTRINELRKVSTKCDISWRGAGIVGRTVAVVRCSAVAVARAAGPSSRDDALGDRISLLGLGAAQRARRAVVHRTRRCVTWG